MITRPVVLTATGGGLLAATGAAAVAAGSEPHLDFDRIDPWLVVFAVGLAVLLGALAFAFHDRASAGIPDPEKRWERALTGWGAFTAAAAAAFAVLGATAGFDPATAAGAIALVGLFECGLIIVALVALVLGG